MTDDELAALRAQVAGLTPEQLAEVLAGRLEQPAPAPSTTGRADARDVSGPNVGANSGIIVAVYGQDASAAQRYRLSRYLEALDRQFKQIALIGLADAQDTEESLALDQVFIRLATTDRVLEAEGKPEELAKYLDPERRPGRRSADFALRPEFDQQTALPDKAIVLLTQSGGGTIDQPEWESISLYRARLATEALTTARCTVLLGEPGGGKSTVLRYIACALARRGLEGARQLPLRGWERLRPVIPLFLPLRRLAGALKTTHHEQAVEAALAEHLRAAFKVSDPEDLLHHALRRADGGRCAAVLLLDGLDEVPTTSTEQSADRRTTLAAVRNYAAKLADRQLPVMISCRTRAFTADLQEVARWPVFEIAPLTRPQIDDFIKNYFADLVEHHGFAADAAASAQAMLRAALDDPRRERLRVMASTPLLLTMMALVVARKRQIPRDRAQLYELIVMQLLGEWDRRKGSEIATLAEQIGDQRLSSNDLRGAIDQLSFQAHRDSTSADGRGRLTEADLDAALVKLFRSLNVENATQAAVRCINYFADRSGLLQPEEDGTVFAFAHLTLQEYCAGRHLLLQPKAVKEVLALRHEDRWREPIALGLGALHELCRAGGGNPERIQALLTELIEQDQKPAARWYRDLLLAAELGAERDWDLLGGLFETGRLTERLRAGLKLLLADTSELLAQAERVQAGDALAALGDDRFPVTDAEWLAEPLPEAFGAPPDYWCRVRGGVYPIGGWEPNETAAKLRLQPFWIVRFPLTVAQYAPFVAEGYTPEGLRRYWTCNGRTWAQQNQQTSPGAWGAPPYNQLNQPVIGVSWYEATAYCAWLSARLASWLPPGYVVRLPSEAEWEAAAAWSAAGKRQRYPWGAPAPTPEHAVYEQTVERDGEQQAVNLGRPAPVGVLPLGAAACGALDLGGQVWEMCSSNHSHYPEQADRLEKDFTAREGVVPWRGGSWWQNETLVRCAARGWNPPLAGDYAVVGFRLVVAPHV